jgi:amino acid adenylation domain-containing protein
VLDAQAHKDFSFTRLVERLQSRRECRVELFRVAFVMEPALPTQESRWTVSQMAVQTGTSKFDLTLELEERGGIIGRFEYASDLFEIGRIRRLIGHFHTLLVAVASDPERRLSELPLLTEAERHQLFEWNTTERTYPKDRYAHQMFEGQVERAPEATALVFEDRKISYRALNGSANRIAHALIEHGVVPDTPVGLCVERSPELIIGLLAILKAGGAYLPLDPDYPKARLAFMLNDCGAPLLVTTAALSERFQGFTGHRLCLGDPKIGAARPAENPRVALSPNHLAYVVYTSGSTGTPKGVLLCHGGLMNLALEQSRLFAIQAGARVLQFAPITFDAATWEIAMALSSGATLVMPGKGEVLAGAMLANRLLNGAITHLTVPPAVIASVEPESLPASLTHLILAGDTTRPEVARRYLPKRSVFNAYGPSETTVCASIRHYRESITHWSIGRPIANTRVYILDESLQPQPIGIPGELCIAGDGLARGYLNRPELTDERFLEIEILGKRERIYRTGDLAHWLPDGNLEFLGRLDHQVKIRGFRIELGEIEAALGAQPGVKETVVIAREDDPGDKRLVTYVVLDQDERTTTAGLRRALVEQLPEYMIPAVFVPLDALPMTPSGKVDRSALPVPELNYAAVGGDCTAPRTPTEHALAELWREVLMLAEPPGIHDDFFDLGGHSLLTTQLLSRIETRFGHALSLRLFLRTPTIEGLSNALSVMSEPLLAGIGDREEYRL